jgi:hypothetical protein
MRFKLGIGAKQGLYSITITATTDDNKISSRWIPHELTEQNRRIKVQYVSKI